MEHTFHGFKHDGPIGGSLKKKERKKERMKQQTQKVECFHGVIPRVSAAPAMNYMITQNLLLSLRFWRDASNFIMRVVPLRVSTCS
ncbi:hypothetical protein MANES_06G038351v8 [Manihot esculenta]|uniref:Uncharacterized protein n=1 Tax=Manihot esculenta TaxID=3983 RepID=A0ACB7HGQ5_MANES|nr:hypothetical protein MANES_06G038351v8 [Manihot esculenta]